MNCTAGSSPPARGTRLLGLIILLVLAGTAWPLSVYEQRAAYRQALDYLTTGRISDFKALRTTLVDYPLRPYLDYHELRSRISTAAPEAIVGFAERHPDLPVSDILFYRWLKSLGTQRRWQTFLTYYRPTTDPELRCFHLRALFGVGEQDAALEQVGELWLAPTSQPKACDPLFEVWIDRGYLTESMVWQRLSMALDANSRTLARYLQRFFESPAVKPWAQRYYAVHVSPSRISDVGNYSSDNRYSRQVIVHGLKRLAGRDPQAAQKAWLSYQDSHDFSPEQAQAVERALLIGHAREGRFPDHDDAREHTPALALALAAVEHERWKELLFWIEQMPPAERTQRRWQYWLARALDETTMNSDRARLTYAALAVERDYYGFLAAEKIGQSIELNHRPSPVSPGELNRIRNLAAIRRAAELYAIGDLINARREWYRLLKTLGGQERAAAAAFAADIGWIAQSIRTATDPALNDALELRFPMPYLDEFKRVGHIAQLPSSFLLAIARQESLFDPRARSSANARGLMQLLHPTASRAARRLGLPEPTPSDLFHPDVNIELGGHHLAFLMDRYGNRRPLAAAAYNAGEHRVDRWLEDASGRWMDTWIESIPYRETRNYVKNVLAFAQVYGYQQGSPRPMLEAHETRLP